MESVVAILMIVVCFNLVLKQTFCKLWTTLLTAVIAALFVGFSWHYAILQSKTQIAAWLADACIVTDMSVILTVDVALQITFCIVAANIMTAGRLPRRTVWTYRLLRAYPGLMPFAVLFSLLVMLIFALPGVSFPLMAWTLAAVVALVIPVATFTLRHLLPEKDLRLELLFLTNALAAVLAILATINGRTAVAATANVDVSALIAVVVITLVGAVAGLIIYRLRYRFRHKNIRF